VTTKTKGKTATVTGDSTKGNTPGSPVSQQVGAVVEGAGMGMSSASDKEDGTGKKEGKLESDPISVATGAVEESIAFIDLPGPIPVAFACKYSSLQAGTGTPLGLNGWTHTYHQWIEKKDELWVHVGEGGSQVHYQTNDGENSVFHRATQSQLTCRKNGTFEIYSFQTRTTHWFAPLEADAGQAMLVGISDSWGNRIELKYENGNLIRITDAVGRELCFEYNKDQLLKQVYVLVDQKRYRNTRFDYKEGDLVSVTSPRGITTQFVYDLKRRMCEKIYANDLRFWYLYDPDHGRCSKVWGTGGLHYVEFIYDFDEQTTVAHGGPQPRLYRWDANGRIVAEETLDGSFKACFTYDEDGKLIEETNASGAGLSYEYNEWGNRTKVCDLAGNETITEYNGPWPCAINFPNGQRQSLIYDDRGNLIEVTYPGGMRFHFTYDRRGNMLAVDGLDGRIQTFEYDHHLNRHRELNAQGAAVTYHHNDLGEPISRTDELGQIEKLVYDEGGSIVSCTYPDGSTATFECDIFGNVTSFTDPLGLVTRQEYSGTGVLTKQVDPDGQTWQLFYDKRERLLEIRNPKSERHSFVYNRFGRIIQEKMFDGSHINYDYDHANRVRRIEFSDGKWLAYKYDPLGYIIEEKSPDGQVLFKRNTLGQILVAQFVEDRFSHNIEYDYDELGRVIKETTQGKEVTFTYDRHGRRATRTLANQQTTTYSYDLCHRPSAVQHGEEKVSFLLDALGQERERVFERSGITIFSTFNASGNLHARSLTYPSPATTPATPLTSRTWNYDAVDQVVRVQDMLWGTKNYRYDSVGNVVEMTGDRDALAFAYNPADCLQSILKATSPSPTWRIRQGSVLAGDGEYEYEYDDNHRRTVRTNESTKQSTKYQWDARQQLRRIHKEDGTVLTFYYDAYGRRVRKEVTPPTTFPLATNSSAPTASAYTVDFWWDGARLVWENDSRNGERTFIHVPYSDEIIFHVQKQASLIYVSDHMGIVKELIHPQHGIVWSGDHSPWGDTLHEHYQEIAGQQFAPPFRLQGHYLDEETSLFCTLFRYFEPKTGRWLSSDPMGLPGGLNLFGFDGCPLWNVDPLGLAGSPPTNTTNSDGSVSSGHYQWLRSRTPTDAIRDNCNPGTGPRTCPIYGCSVNRLEADHVVPMHEICQQPGFGRLTPAQQLAILNDDNNFVGLGKSANGSKQAKSVNGWIDAGGHKRLGRVPAKGEQLLRQKDKKARAALKKAIAKALADNGLESPTTL
jgi:RHS repeat-associated protein